MTDGVLRTFVAVKLRGEALESAARTAERLAKSTEHTRAIKWEKRGNLHVTLHFLGDTPEEHIPAVQAAIEQAAAKHDPFSLTVGPPAWFGGRKGPRVIILGCNEGSDELIRLQQTVAEQLDTLGYPKDRRPFHPHITVARVRRNQKVETKVVQAACRKHEELDPTATMPVDRASLLRSELTPNGAIYSVLWDAPLKKH